MQRKTDRATRALGPGHPDLPPVFQKIGQPVLVGGTMGTASIHEGVRRMRFSSLLERTEAKELTQDAFVRAWEKLGAFRGDAAFGTWLHRLAVNVVLMDRRQAARRREDAIEDEGAAAPAAPREQPELRMDIETAVRALPPMARQVLVLYDIEGYEHAEIGRTLGIAEGTSKAHLFRARRLLREVLAP